MTKKKEEPEDRVKAVHPLQRAWLAGVIDARAQFPKAGYVVYLESTDQALIERVHRTANLGKLSDRERKKVCSHPLFRFEVTNMNDCRDLLLMVSPFLSGRNMTKAATLIDKIERNPTWRKQNPEKASSSVISPAPPADQ